MKMITIILVMSVMFVLMINYVAGSNMTIGLVSCWALENNLTDSFGGFTGNLSGAEYVTGHLGTGLGFNPAENDHWFIPDSAADPYDNIAEMTLNMWINMTDRVTANSRLGHLNSAWSVLAEQTAEDEIRFRVNADSNIEVDAQGQPNVYGEWAMLTVTYKAQNYSIYWNGTSVHSEAQNTGSIDDVSVNLYFGIDEDETTQEFNGSMDEVTFWNRALNSSEISELYNNTQGLTCAEIIQTGEAPSVPYAGPNWYVDRDASCANTDGNTTSPFCSIFNLTTITIEAGDNITFDDCDVHSGFYDFGDNDGTAANPITFKSDNNCDGLADIFGSINYSDTSQWTQISTNIWETTGISLPNQANLFVYNVNNYISGGSDTFGTRETSSGDVNSNGDYWYNSSGNSLIVFSNVGNPATFGNGIEITNYETSQDAIIRINIKDYVIVTGLSFSYGNERCLYNQLGNNVNITDNMFHACYQQSIFTNGNGENLGINVLIENNTINSSGIQMNQSFEGSQGEGIFMNSANGVTVIDNVLDWNYGVNINAVTCEGIIVRDNVISNIPFDNSVPAGIYMEACNDTLVENNNITNAIQGLNIGVESTTKTVRNYTYRNNIVHATVNFINTDSAVADVLQNLSLYSNTWIRTDCNVAYGNVRQLFWDNLADLNFSNNIIVTDCSLVGRKFVDWEETSYPEVDSNYNLWYDVQGSPSWRVDGSTSYNNLTAWTANTGQDVNSNHSDPLFVDFANGNYQPTAISPACNMSSEGGFVGVIPCAAALPIIQTPTPNQDLLNISQNNESILLNASSLCQEKCLLYQDGVNLINFSLFPFNRTDLLNNTLYSFNFTIFNSSNAIPESNFSNTISATTSQNTEPPDISEPLEAVTLLLVGVMFWLVHVGFKIETRNEEDELLPIQSMISMILFSSAGIMAYLAIQVMLGIGLANNFNPQIMAGLNGIHTFMTWAGFIVLVLAILGLLITSGKWMMNLIQENVLK